MIALGTASASDRIESALHSAIARGSTGAPPTLARALHYAVFPGGARVRPRLCVAVAAACGEDLPALTDAAAASIELLHCASLVHDDLPCFDDAPLRRGKPSVHRAFGEPLAVLAGDALILLPFDLVARVGVAAPERLPALIALLSRAAGSTGGLVAGQAWESEPAPSVPLDAYHRAKTGSLFRAATMAGAIAAGSDPTPWSLMGERLGEAYQVADDLLDAVARPDEAGKPVQRDAALARPSSIATRGVDGTVAHLRALIDAASAAVPACPGAAALRALVVRIAERLVPASLRQTAA